MQKTIEPGSVPEIHSSCDLPINNEEEFEFSNEMDPQVFSTEDIIFRGKILPYKVHQKPTHTSNEGKYQNFYKKRSESLDDSRSSIYDPKPKECLFRNSHSLNYRKLNRISSTNITPNELIRSDKSSGRSDRSVQLVPSTPAKPRWHLFMFGSVKFPPEMNLTDIKNRQSRRSPTSFFPSFENNEDTLSVKKGAEKRSWKFLRALSCKGHANVVVTASLSFINPRV